MWGRFVKQQDIDNLRQLMEFEAAREPHHRMAFPRCPICRAAATRIRGFYELEKAAPLAQILAAGRPYRRGAGTRLLLALGECRTAGRHRPRRQRLHQRLLQHLQPSRRAGRHRSSGQAARLTCKYHGWSYTHDGELVAIRDPKTSRAGLLLPGVAGRALRTVRQSHLREFRRRRTDLLDWLGPIADEWQEFQFDKCRLTGRHIFDLECNWKIAMESNTEVYHVRSIHPKTVAPMLDDRRNVNTFYANGHGRMVAPRRQGNRAAANRCPRT